MGIVSTGELRQPRSSTHGKDWARTYQRRWLIETDDPNIDAKYVRANGPVFLGNTYSANGGTSVDTGSYVQEITVDCASEDGLSWHFTANYGPYDPEKDKPNDRTIKFEMVASQIETIVDYDKDGNPIVNSAGDFFDPPLTEEDSRPVLNVTRYQYSIDMNIILLYRNAISSDRFLGRDPGTWRSHHITFGPAEFDPDYGRIFKVSYQFSYNPEGWARKVVDAGLREKYSSGTKLKPILKLGVPVQSPVPLDGSGAALAVGGTLRTRTYHTRPELPFSILGFVESDFEGLVW